MGDYQEFAAKAAEVEAVASKFIEEWYGPRCSDYDEDCLICIAWKQLDDLLANPFNDR